mgnify:FL=1
MGSVLVGAGLLLEIEDEVGTTYLPVHDIGTVRLVDVLAAVRNAGESRYLSVDQLTPVRAVDELMSETRHAIETKLGERTLKDLILSDDSEPGSTRTLPVAGASAQRSPSGI